MILANTNLKKPKKTNAKRQVKSEPGTIQKGKKEAKTSTSTDANMDVGALLNGTITTSYENHPYTGVPCFVLKQTFPNCTSQQIFVNKGTLPQLFHYIVSSII